MHLADLAIKRPIFISCIVTLVLILGFLSMSRLGVDLFPNITFPVVSVTVPYPGAGPAEVETLVTKVLEDEISTVAGIKRLSSDNREGIGTVVAEFTLETDIKYVEQQVRDRVSSAKRKLPTEIKEPVIRTLDPADQPILIVSLSGTLSQAKLYDYADQTIRPRIEQVNQVGLVELLGARKREIHVNLDQNKLKSYDVSATKVSTSVAAAGINVPAGKVNRGKEETVFRTLGEFHTVPDVENTIVNFVGNDVPVRVADIAKVEDTLEDETSRTFYNGTQAIFLYVFRQSGANTIAVVNQVVKRIEKLNEEVRGTPGDIKLTVVRDGAKPIRANVQDVKESIFLGIFLTVIVVFFFLGSGRSTLITGLALPNSLLGAFILMAVAHFTINTMTLLAMSLAVGLLIDDAIVVRENIFRHIEMGEKPSIAASLGTKEVTLAVIATTLTVIAVFGPVAFLQGIVGQFFKEFGLTICFAMMISLFDALTVAPMLSAYFAGGRHDKNARGLWASTVGRLLNGFDRFQTGLENLYESLLKFTMRRPFVIIGAAIGIFVLSLGFIAKVPKTFLPPQDFGEFEISLELPPGASLDAMSDVARQVDTVLRKNKEVTDSVLIIGNSDGEANKTTFYVELVPPKMRSVNTNGFKDKLREQLKPFAYANPTVKDIDMVAGGMRPFNVNIVGEDMAQLEVVSNQLLAKLKNHPALKDPETSYKTGRPEFQVDLDEKRAARLGVSSTMLGTELRTLIEGALPAVFRENGREYDIRVRLKEDQRNLRERFYLTFVPNINNRLIRLADVAKGVPTVGPANILRQDRSRYIQISADLAPKGPGLGDVMDDIRQYFKSDIKLPPGVEFRFIGQAENFQELLENMLIAAALAVIFIYFVLASLYESFVTPFTIMLVLPLAACGAFFALYITGSSFDIYSIIGCVMLLGIATKNSILLVDLANQLIGQGVDRRDAIIQSGKTRLRPILMTTVALIAGMAPVAIGLNEASKQRTSMGITVIGGLVSSTLLSLVVVPACFTYIDRFRLWAGAKLKVFFAPRVSELQHP